jgi:hypothetical protein
MSDNFSSVGYRPDASYGTVDTRSIDEIQGGAPGASYTAAAPTGASYGVDLRSIDEIQRGNLPATGGLQQQDKGNGFVSDVGVGFIRGAKNTVRGVVLLGKGLFGAIAHPGETKQKIGEWGAYAISHPGQTLSRTVTLPFRMAGAMVQPYSDAIKSGRPGLAVGQLGFDAALAYATTKAVDVVRNGRAPSGGGAVGGDDAGVMTNGGKGGGSGSGAVRGGGSVNITQQNKVGSIKTGAVHVNGNNNVIVIGGNANGAVNGGTSSAKVASDLASGADDLAGTMSRTTRQGGRGGLFGFFGGDDLPQNVGRGANGRFVSMADQTMNVADDMATGTTRQGGFFSRLFGNNGGGSTTWVGTRNMTSPKSTFNSVAGGIDNVFNSASGIGTSVSNAFHNSVSWLDRGLTYLHPDNMMAGLQKVGNAVVNVPRFVVNNPATSLKYAVAGTATAAYTAGQVVVNSARFAIANPGHAAVLVAATGRTIGALPVRNEQRSNMAYDPDL